MHLLPILSAAPYRPPHHRSPVSRAAAEAAAAGTAAVVMPEAKSMGCTTTAMIKRRPARLPAAIDARKTTSLQIEKLPETCLPHVRGAESGTLRPLRVARKYERRRQSGSERKKQ